MRGSTAATRQVVREPNENPPDQSGRQIRVPLGHQVQRRGQVAVLGAVAVVLARAAPDAAEVEAQNGQAGLLESTGRPVHDVVLHRAAAQGVRVAEHGCCARRTLGFPQDSLEPADRSFEVDSHRGSTLVR